MKRLSLILFFLVFLLSGCSSQPKSNYISPKTDREHDIAYEYYDDGYNHGYEEGWEKGFEFARENLLDWVPDEDGFYEFLDDCVDIGYIKSYRK